MKADTIRPTPGRGDKASIDRPVLQTGALQRIIRISTTAEVCAGAAFAVSHDYAGPDWMGGERQWLHLHNPLAEADKWVYGEIGP
jgi:hypothetical protein